MLKSGVVYFLYSFMLLYTIKVVFFQLMTLSVPAALSSVVWIKAVVVVVCEGHTKN